MSRRVFEYFFDPEELEPFYSELPEAFVGSTSAAARGLKKTSDMTEKPTVFGASESLAKPSAPADSHDDNRAITEGIKTDPAGVIQQERHCSVEAKDLKTEPVVDDVDAPKSAALPAKTPSRTRVRRLLSVHALGQYVYCVRAAICAAERGDDHDSDEGLPRLTYLPNFDRERIEEALSEKIMQLGFFVLYGVFFVILMKMGLADQRRWVFYPSLLAFFGLCFWSLNVFVCIVELAIRRRAAIRAEAREPEPSITGIECVNWWSMLKAGFEPITYQRPFQHPELPLEGCPWRVLQRESRRIPIIKSGGRKLGPTKGTLYRKHEVRLVAYALLLESTGHTDVPYGLVFPVDSANGLALPITDELREQAVRLLGEFEHRLADSQQHDIHPPLPESRNRCTNCDYGRPVPTTVREVKQARKSGQQLVVLQHRSGDLYRCDCGDRFGSAPPHGLTIKKGLTAAVD